MIQWSFVEKRKYNFKERESMWKLYKPHQRMRRISFSVPVASEAMILMELNKGQFLKLDPAPEGEGYEIHIVSPLCCEGSFIHNGEIIEFSCKAFPIITSGMQLKDYPQQMTPDIQAKIFDKALVCGPLKYEQIKNQAQDNPSNSVIDYQTAEFWGKPYELTFEFSLA